MKLTRRVHLTWLPDDVSAARMVATLERLKSDGHSLEHLRFESTGNSLDIIALVEETNDDEIKRLEGEAERSRQRLASLDEALAKARAGK